MFSVHICGVGEFNADFDGENTIQAPAYPGSYGGYMYCWYAISAPEDLKIQFWINDFETEIFHSPYFSMSVSFF